MHDVASIGVVSIHAISDPFLINREKKPLALAGREASRYHGVSVVDQVARGWKDADYPGIFFARNDGNTRSIEIEHCARRQRIARA